MSKQIIKLCSECTFIASTGDYTILDHSYTGGDDPDGDAFKRMVAIFEGLDRLGWFTPHAGHNVDLTCAPCDCCNTKKAGERSGFIWERPAA